MITQREIDISNKSYTNKDFGSIYPESIDFLKQLSPKWNPETTNESDPGIVLAKLAAFNTDKAAYLADKAVLESNLISAVQEESVKGIAEANGYYAHYYRSGETLVSAMYTGKIESSFTLEPFKTTFTDENNEIIYTLVKPLTLSEQNVENSALAIQGEVSDLRSATSDSVLITLSDLDDNNRIYFSEEAVAENGVFVQYSDTGSAWEQVENLNYIAPGNPCYIFRFDSKKGLPYLEFPNDIATLIGAGLNIKYIISAGNNGNIAANFLVKRENADPIYYEGSTEEVPLVDAETNKELLIITNSAGVTNGRNPESINEIANGYKKKAGTFDTLVTCRDFANYIYNMTDNENNFVVSNCQVADRRFDINYANSVLSHNGFSVVNISKEDKTEILPYQLCLYPLNPIKSVYNVTTYNNSFKPLVNETFIRTQLNDAKSMSYDYKELDNTDIYLFKNYYRLNARIYTKSKVNKFEEVLIINNVREALFRAFNAREIDYGEEIPYSTLLEVISNADSRISSVILDEPILKTKVMRTSANMEKDLLPKNATEINFDLTDYINYAAKNIVAGKVSLFKKDTRFDYKLGQTELSIYGNQDSNAEITTGNTRPLASLGTKFKIKLSTNESTNNKEISNLTLKENQVLQFFAPNFATEVTYPYGCVMHYTGATIEANTEYALSSGDALTMSYTDEADQEIDFIYTNTSITKKVNGSIVSVTATNENIIKPNFRVIDGMVTPDYDGYILAAKEQIEIRKRVETVITDKGFACFWYTNRPNNALFLASDQEGSTNKYSYILQAGESFMYTDSTKTTLTVLGSGTKLTITTAAFVPTDWVISKDNAPSLEDVSQHGLAAFKDYAWQYRNFSTDHLIISELQIFTMIDGDTLNMAIFPDTTDAYLENAPLKVESVNYELSDGTSGSLPALSVDYWQVRSRLDVNAGPSSPQEIKFDIPVESGDEPRWTEEMTLTFVTSPAITASITGGIIESSIFIQQPGSDTIDLATVDLDGTNTNRATILNYSFVQPMYPIGTTGAETPLKYNAEGYTSIPLKDFRAATVEDYYLPIVEEEHLLLMVYYAVNKTPAASKYKPVLTLKKNGESLENMCLFKNYLVPDSFLTDQIELEPGVNMIIIPSSAYAADSTYTLELSQGAGASADPADWEQEVLVVSPLYMASGWNNFFDEAVFGSNSDYTGLLQKVQELGGKEFFVSAALDKTKMVESTDIFDPLALFDYNNVVNKFTIAELDFTNSTIAVAKISQE